MSEYHKRETVITTTNFQTYDDFLAWKKDVEKKTSSWFVQHRQAREGVHHSTAWFYCNRTGNVRTRGDGKRAFKIQGSSKIDEKCCAFMRVTIDNDTKEVQVKHSLSHVGHDTRLGHLRISEELRTKIAGKLARKIPVEAILDEIRDNLGADLNRDHLTSKQDMHNIMHQFNITHVQKHSQDATSVHCWVNDLRDREYDSVLCYKPQGELKYGLPQSDFLLGIQTEFQKDTMKKHASKLVCLDSTHCTTGYDFLLVTVLVKDEYGEGVPVAWLISNREDICSLDPFFAALKERIGSVEVTDFMSDDAEAFYNAWTRNFPPPKRQLLCAWHVDKSLRTNIYRNVSNIAEQVNLYKIVKVLQVETDQKEFKKKLQEFCAFAEDRYPSFYDYFKAEFLKRQKMWAYCYRASTTANTNMALENFHRVLKTCYFQRRRNKRVDHLLGALLKIARDKAFEAWEKLEKGKRTNKIKEIDKRHKNSLLLQTTDVDRVSENEWKFPSPTLENVIYSVIKESDCDRCKMRCSSCGVCVHEYTCSCPDFVIHSVPCKHIHSVHTANLSTEQAQTVTTSGENASEVIENERSYFESQIREPMLKDDSCEELKKNIAGIVDVFVNRMQECKNREALNAARAHLSNALTVLNGISTTHETIEQLEIKQKIPSNKTFDKQPRFYSTKKKIAKKKKSLTKPTTEEKVQIREILEETIPNVCGVCFEENDQTNDRIVQWLQCSGCEIWLHKACHEENNEGQDDYCSLCWQERNS